MAKKSARPKSTGAIAVEKAGANVRTRDEPARFALGRRIKTNRMLRLKGSDKTLALQQMISCAARALNLSAGEQLDLSAAVQAREAALNTQLGAGWAAPHAALDVADELIIVVGRSKSGIDYGRLDELGRVHLIFLFISSPKSHDDYLRALSSLAAAFKDPEHPDRLEKAIAADTPRKLRVALGEVVRRRRLFVSRRLPALTRTLLRYTLRFADDIEADPIILFADVMKNPALLSSFVSKRIVLATRAGDLPEELVLKARGVVRLARGDFSEESAVQLALLSAGARGLLGDGTRVIALCGVKGSDNFHTIRIQTPRLMIQRIFSKRGKEVVQPEVFERAIQLMVELAEEGREGRPIGTAMILGDTEAVSKMSQQLTINPFRGYEERERSIMDPALEETIKEFSSLDGAFVVDRNGILQSAGTYLSPPAEIRVELPSGLGTRHRVAAALSKATNCISIVLSQSTGLVTVFRNGATVLSVAPARKRGVVEAE